MKTLTLPTPRNAQQAAVQSRVLSRALDLCADGYTYQSSREVLGEGQPDDLYAVKSPAGKIYIVDMMRQTCDCEFFKANRYCKHYLAIEHDLVVCEQIEDMQESTRFMADCALEHGLGATY